MVDETTDTCGRYIANIIVGKLDAEEPGPARLICCKELKKTNHQTVSIAVRDALSKCYTNILLYFVFVFIY